MSKREPLAVLLELTKGLTDVQPLEDALHAVTDAALDLFPANHASIRLLDESRTELLSGARSGAGTSMRPSVFRTGEGVIGWVVDQAEVARIPDAGADPRFTPHSDSGFEVRSLLAVPLLSAGNVVGVLSVSSAASDAFAPEDELLARLLANCTSPLIDRSRLERLAVTDHLTRAFTVRYLAPRMAEEMERTRRQQKPLSVLMMDLDHFKNVNDRYGHLMGDRVLRAFADCVRDCVRRLDVLVRRGGEEFLLIMPATGTEDARQVAERIRGALESRAFETDSGEVVRQTVSIGVATWDEVESPETLESRADAAMYEAKSAGRNRIALAS